MKTYPEILLAEQKFITAKNGTNYTKTIVVVTFPDTAAIEAFCQFTKTENCKIDFDNENYKLIDIAGMKSNAVLTFMVENDNPTPEIITVMFDKVY